ncbi:bile acid:sodium symporter family protein [Sansalvadorimonas sp. 2012CJ34-2]|uniref:Bile acid:sodium symporter family protein n=1 Tax=Parendozoicomonas callyspongiae TaxID=2942213 RepID=A0ABT0PM65_9GAMM|nr:bile acid:sodium symporter family protein [Sansalvadorimonas sp. 2012CJ34-2]MCL6272066.1 bile acid:sodium symporter family protein [Sansalvadorimonas sp. 2012CJ34-2]
MTRLPTLMPLIALLAGIAGYSFSPTISAGKGMIVPVLAVIMLCMGLTLKLKDFRTVVNQPSALLTGLVLQFFLMPLLAWLISVGLGLSAALMAGMVLVGTAPGGTASNVLVYLSGGNVALSISMTTVSTIAAIFATPLLTAFYLHETVDVDQVGMLISIVQIVIVPVLLGTIVNTYKPQLIDPIRKWLPNLSVLTIAYAISVVVALNAGNLESIGIAVLAGVLLHNSIGLFGGYWLARVVGCDIQQARTIAIEVGTQNSGLSVALAIKHFTVMAALPGAIFSVTQNVLGACLASWWRFIQERQAPES